MGPLSRLVTRLIPTRPEVIPEVARPRYLQDAYLETPALALDRIRLETFRYGEQVAQLNADATPAVVSGTEEDLDAIVTLTGDNQKLYDEINEFIRRLSEKELTAAETRLRSFSANTTLRRRSPRRSCER